MAEKPRKPAPTLPVGDETLPADALTQDSPPTLSPEALRRAQEIDQLGDYRIVRELGRGGMGVVYLAVEESLDRQVALKVLPTGALQHEQARARFLLEARAAANLHHPNIVQVHGVGREGDVDYYSMQFVEGRGLDALVGDGRKPSVAEAVRITLQAARGLAYAHSRGTLHRDIKPANVMIDESGTARLTDFGLAKLLTDEDDLTATGDVIGTIRYMPPERFEGTSEERGDIYSLGITLYELLTGKPAFAERNPVSAMQAIREEGPAPLRSVEPSVPADLEIITTKAIARDPQDRYENADAFADDLQRFLEDRPILARRASPVERLVRWCRRNRSLAVASGVAVAALLVAAATGWTGYWMTSKARDAEAERRGEAELATARAEANEKLSLEALEAIFETLAGDDRGGRGGAGKPPDKADEGDAELLQQILTFYDRFAEQNGTDPRLRFEAARAQGRVAVLRARLGQPDESRASFATAIASLDGLAAEFPQDAQYREALARTLLDAAVEASDPAHIAEAVARCARAIDLTNELLEQGHDKRRCDDLLLTADLRLAALHARAGREELARESLKAAAARRGEMEKGSNPDRFARGTDLVRAVVALSDLLHSKGRTEEALGLFDRLDDQLATGGRTGRRRTVHHKLAQQIQQRRAELLRSLGRDDEAEAAERSAEGQKRPPKGTRREPRQRPRRRQ